MSNTKLPTNTVKPEISFFENETLNRLLNFDREISLDSKLELVDSFMKNNTGAGLSDTEKDDLYAKVQELLKDYQKTLRDVKFNFFLNRPQYNLLTDLLLKRMEYDVNTLFIAIELTKLLAGMSGSKYSNDTQLNLFETDPTEMTYIYHLIQTHKVKGLTKEAYVFSSLLIRIGEISKVINYYDAYAKSLMEDIQKWALSLDAADSNSSLVMNGESVETQPVAVDEMAFGASIEPEKKTRKKKVETQ